MTMIFDQIHLGVPDPLSAVDWYQRYFDFVPGDHVDRAMCGDVRFIFLKNPSPSPSREAAIDYAGLSMASLSEKLRVLANSGMRIIESERRFAGVYQAALIEDPWGARIELIENPNMVGLQHVHLTVPDPRTALNWYVEMFGGQIGKFNGRVDGVRYGDVWILAEAGNAAPSSGHTIDHIGWRMSDLRGTAVELKAKGLKFIIDPHPGPTPYAPPLMSFAEDPWGVKIELLQRAPILEAN